MGLALLLGAVAITGVAWAVLVPPFQAPDENTHFAYAQGLVERGHLPGDSRRRPASTEQEQATIAANADQTSALTARARDADDFSQTLEAKPEWSEEAYERWRSTQRTLPEWARSDNGGVLSSNPPLYYAYQAPAYAAASGGDIFDRLYLMRIWSIAMLLVTATGAWLLAGELFNRDRLLQLVTASVAGLQPMVVFISSSLNADAMLFALWSIALWLGVRVLRRGLTVRDAAALSAVVGLALVAKSTSLALLPAAGFALGVAASRTRKANRRVTPGLGAAALAMVVTAGAWFATAAALDRSPASSVETGSGQSTVAADVVDLGSYLWQFYLPKMSFQQPFGGMPDLPVYDIWLKQGWAAFGWLEVRFPPVVYAVLAIISAAALAGSVMFIVRRRRKVDLAVVSFFGIAALALLAGLHWTEFRTLTGGSGPFNQGRYLLPLIALGGAAVAATCALLPPARRTLAGATVLGGLFALQLFSLALVGARFYA